MIAIVPTNTWHQFESDGVILITATPQPTEHLRFETIREKLKSGRQTSSRYHPKIASTFFCGE
jgi:hypothetical protein